MKEIQKIPIILVYFVVITFIAGCQKSVHKELSASKNNTTDMDLSDYYQNVYVVAIDSGLNYYDLKNKMHSVSRELDLKIDTLGREYNRINNKITLPLDADDEIYAGDYLPRRNPSNFLSIEYLNFYKKGSNKKEMAIIAGIYNTKQKADSANTSIQKVEKNSMVISSEIYMGCMH